MIRALPNSWGYQTGNTLTTRPVSGAGFGTSITPGNNTYGSYASILAGGSIANDCYWLEVCINANTVSAAARDTIVTIGVDSSGGTAYEDLIPHLLASCAANYGSLQNGVLYAFPVFVKAGSQLAAKASVNNATVGTLRVSIKLYGQPSRPDSIWWGHSVEAIGINTGTSAGTDVTSGTTSEGSWTSLGTSVRRCCYWQLGVGINNSAMSNFQYHLDISTGDASNKSVILQDVPMVTTTNETLSMAQGPAWLDVPAGGTIYARAQCSSTAQTLNMAAYGVRP
jgi:hypothetical protein